MWSRSRPNLVAIDGERCIAAAADGYGFDCGAGLGNHCRKHPGGSFHVQLRHASQRQGRAAQPPAIPSRPCRQPAAAARVGGGARGAQSRLPGGGRLAGDRGPLHRASDPQAGGGRAARRDRWRISPRLLALRFRLGAGRGGDLRAGTEDPVQGRHPAACATGERADRLVEAGDGGSLSVCRGPCADGGAEDDHSVAQRGAFPRWTAGDRSEGVSGPGRVLRRSGRGVPARRWRRSAPRAAATCRSTR